MASKTHLLIFLSIAIMATSIADAQISVPAIIINVSGTVNCTLNSTVGVAPPFPNATVQLQCPLGNIVATATTNSSGGFNLSVNALRLPLANCRVVVATSLVNCNATLPRKGSLVSEPLIFVGEDVDGNITIVYCFAESFAWNTGIGVN